ncbi:MAG TPA: hypothetical protein VGU20_06945 [Stellaceae bacterium]|nr:hypothetical protein [Stellaceae bacterium]
MQARAALAAALELGVPVTLESAPAAGGYAGPGWWLALIVAAQAEHPAADVIAVLDCGEEPGSALAALRAGVPRIRFTGAVETRARLAAIAAQLGAAVEGPAVEENVLDLLEARDPLALLRRFLARNQDGS